MNVGPKRCVPPEHVNKTMPRKRVFVDAFKDTEVRSSWVWVALNPASRFLVRIKRRETGAEDELREDKGRGRRERAASAETPGAPETGKGREDPTLEPLEDHTTLISGVWSPGLGEGELQLFKPTQLVIICYRSRRTATQTLLCRILEGRISLKADGGWITEP